MHPEIIINISSDDYIIVIYTNDNISININ